MTDGDALLANVVAADCRTAEEKIARWADDAPRKVYADWLMEHGQEERGRYIIFALDYDYHRELGEGDGGHVTDTEWEPEADCWPCMSWPDSLSTLTRLPAKELAKWKFEWRRGFVHSLTCTAANWLAHADAIVTQHPVREVTLTTWPEWESPPIINPPRRGRYFKFAGRALHFFEGDWRGGQDLHSTVARELHRSIGR